MSENKYTFRNIIPVDICQIDEKVKVKSTNSKLLVVIPVLCPVYIKPHMQEQVCFLVYFILCPRGIFVLAN